MIDVKGIKAAQGTPPAPAATSGDAAGNADQSLEARIARLKPYQWPKGVSGNPTGKARTLPISDKTKILLESCPLPAYLRHIIELGIRGTLPEDMTIADGIAFGRLAALWGVLPERAFKPEAVRQLVVDVEGTSTQRQVAPGQEDQQPDEPVDMQDRIIGEMIKMMRGRNEIYEMEDPELDADYENARKRLSAGKIEPVKTGTE